MSCEQGPNKIGKWAGRLGGGISQLASKRGFYAGLALGGAGLLGAGLVAAARRRSRGNLPGSLPPARPASQVMDTRQIPALTPSRPVTQLAPREKVRPLASAPAGERCAGCQTPAGGKPGAWYRLNGRTYCPDCAPEAAGPAGVDLVAPAAPAPAMNFGPAETKPAARTAETGQPAAGRQGASYLPAERRAPTKLIGSRIGVLAGQNDQGQPVRLAVNGYVVLRENGADTGLAVTPALRVTGDGGVEEDTQRWWLTHIPSGKHIPGAGAYGQKEEAELLAGVLAQIDWTRDEDELTADEIRQVAATVTAYNAALAEQQPPGTAAAGGSAPTSRRVPADESLEGKLVADGYGGVARVLEDSGRRLYVIDSLGERYEVDRRQVRTPDEADFEGVRVAMSFDPAQSPPAKCALCGRPTSGTGAGEMWYKMNFKTFCEGCADQYAAQEGYGKEEEIGDAAELVHRITK